MSSSLTVKPRLDPKTLPSAARDDFTVPLMEAAAAMLDAVDFRLVLAEFIDTAPAASLPALTRELSLEDLIEPGMSESVQRHLLKRWYEIHEAKGTLYGIRLVLSLLGMKTRWTQWYEQTPKANPAPIRRSSFLKRPSLTHKTGCLTRVCNRSPRSGCAAIKTAAGARPANTRPILHS